jgi:hypothetical protein
MPLLQVLLPGQAMPHSRQLSLLVCRFTQVPEQRVRPGAHVHVPPLHTSTPTGQPRLHIPQWFWLLLVSTQLPLQSVRPTGQPQRPLTHSWPSLGQVKEQNPQLVRSLDLLTHVPLHSSGSALCGSQTQPLTVQTRPVPAAQTFPQPRQLFGSVKLTQPLLHRI